MALRDRPLPLRLLLFFTAAVVVLFLVELVAAVIVLILQLDLDIVAGRSDRAIATGIVSLLIWWRLWVTIVRGGRFWTLRWAQAIGATIFVSVLAFAAVVIIAQAKPSRDEAEAEALSMHVFDITGRAERAPAGPIQVTAGGHAFWDRYLKATPTCGSDNSSNLQVVWILTNLGRKYEITCASRILFDSGSPNGKPPLPDRLFEAFQR